MGAALSVAVGLGLAAAAGFRIFVPLLVLGIASRTGHLPLAAGFDWVSTTPGLIALGTATALEIVAYYVPWLDHLLDVAATPTAVLAGVLSSAAVITDLPPAVKWAIALVAGGGAAGIVQGATVLARLKSAVTTAGLANPIVATFELFSSILTSILALLVPVLVLLLIGFLCLAVFLASGRFVFGRRKAPQAPRS